MAKVPAPTIVTCGQWDAVPPKSPPVKVGRPRLVVIHHTAGHASAKGLEGAKQYARDIQNYHMNSNGWNDSGHNFLVTRDGFILQGRWGTVTQIERGRMVSSAHCPGENDQPGIEHEHKDNEAMTDLQFQASSLLIAWICDRTGIRPTQLFGHGHFYPTACPANLDAKIPALRARVASILTHYHGIPDA